LAAAIWLIICIWAIMAIGSAPKGFAPYIGGAIIGIAPNIGGAIIGGAIIGGGGTGAPAFVEVEGLIGGGVDGTPALWRQESGPGLDAAGVVSLGRSVPHAKHWSFEAQTPLPHFGQSQSNFGASSLFGLAAAASPASGFDVPHAKHLSLVAQTDLSQLGHFHSAASDALAASCEKRHLSP